MTDKSRVTAEKSDIYDDLMRFRPDGISLNRWANLAGVSRTVWTDMRRHGNPARRTLEKLLSAAGSSLAEFEALRLGPESIASATPRATVSDLGRGWRGAPRATLPVLAVRSQVSEDGWEVVVIGEPLPGETVDRPARLALDATAHAVTMTGEAMWPRFRAGRRLIVSSVAPIEPGDDVLVRLANGGAMIKELVGQSDQQVELRQFNPDRTMRLARAEIERIDKVVGEAL